MSNIKAYTLQEIGLRTESRDVLAIAGVIEMAYKNECDNACRECNEHILNALGALIGMAYELRGDIDQYINTRKGSTADE